LADRIQKCVIRDKNRPCVVIWSAGNESAYGCIFEDALRWIKEYDSTRLTHYEGALWACKDRKADYSNLDLYSRMYPSVQKVIEYTGRNLGKPIILCEYSHAAGNSQGDLEDYFQMIEQYDNVCGAFIWEYCDHGIFKGIAEDGRKMYFYGGDHGEFPHSGCGCVDGLVYPDRRPHTGFKEFKHIQRPVRITNWNIEEGQVTLHNYLDFLNLKEYALLNYELTCDGQVIDSGMIGGQEGVDIAPHGEATVDLKLQVPEEGKCYLRLISTLKADKGCLPAGFLLGYEEVAVPGEKRTFCRGNAGVGVSDGCIDNRGAISVTENDKCLILQNEKFRYVYNKFTGLFSEIVIDNKKFLNYPMELNIWRAPTNNDTDNSGDWRRAGYDRAVTRAYETRYEETNEGITIESVLSMAPIYLQRILNIRAEWKVTADGRISAAFAVKKDPEFPALPRFGLRLFLPKEMKYVEYYGLGPEESYIDKHHASFHGIFKAEVEMLHEDYIFPQENGSHADCDYVKMAGDDKQLLVTGGQSFSFNASVYTQEELDKKKHNFELIPSDSTVLCVDYRQNGIGSQLLGVMEKYQFAEEEFTFSVELDFVSY